MSDLFQLIYVSAASDDFDPKEFPAILEKSRENNSKLDISGLLIFHEASFIQVLEGPKSDVQQLMTKIKLDSRHKNLKILSQKNLEEKEFESWSMGFFNSSLSEGQTGFVDLASELARLLTDGTTSEKALSRFKDGAWKKLVES